MYIHEGIPMKGRKTLAAFLVESAAYRIFHDISISLANDIPLGSCFFLPPRSTARWQDVWISMAMES